MGARILVVDDSPTIRKIVSSILRRHEFTPIEAADGVEALSFLSSEEVDLVLVDFVMPKMNGYQLCMTLRQQEVLKDLPVVLMSAKGDRIRGKFVQQTGALDAITKPFDARGLIAVVQSALAKKQEGRRTEPPLSDELSSSPDHPSDTSTAHATRAILRLSDHLAQLLVPELRQLRAPTLTTQDVSQAFLRALTPEATRALSDLVREDEWGESAEVVLSGDLASISIAEILQLLDLQRKTGALTLSQKRSRVTLFIRNGALDFATYAGLPEEFLLGRYLLDSGALSREKLDAAIEQARGSGRVLGDFLVQEQILEEEQVQRALRNQTSELLYEVVRWTAGRFRFVQQTENHLAERARLGLPTAGLVMEGFRRVDEWRLIEGSFDFSDVLFRDALAVSKMEGRQDLTEEELRVLSAIDGETTVAEIIDSLEGSSFEICKILYRLLNSRLVKRQGVSS